MTQEEELEGIRYHWFQQVNAWLKKATWSEEAWVKKLELEVVPNGGKENVQREAQNYARSSRKGWNTGTWDKREAVWKVWQGETEEEEHQSWELCSTGAKDSRMIPTAIEENGERQGWFGQQSLLHSKGLTALSNNQHQIKSTKSSEQGVGGIQVPNDWPESQRERMQNGEAKDTTRSLRKFWSKTKEQQHVHTINFRSS